MNSFGLLGSFSGSAIPHSYILLSVWAVSLARKIICSLI